MSDFDYSDLFVAGLIGWAVLRSAEWAFVSWMIRRDARSAPDHCPGCTIPSREDAENRAFVQDILDSYGGES